ncbi:MAG: LamG domain-containing protein [Pirellulales bacterium]|nr:LamG domain-containing protein [Pirellulales bacterium]
MISDKRIAWALTTMVMVGLFASVAGAETIGLWTFNEKAVGQVGNNGDTVLDTSGSANTHNGTIVTNVGDDVPYVAGSPSILDGAALEFEQGSGAYPNPGIKDCVEVPAHTDFNYTKSDSYTIEVMVKSDQVVGSSTGTGPLVGGLGTFWLDDDTEGKVVFASGFGLKKDTYSGPEIDTRAKVWSTTYVNDGEWHHVAGVFDGTAQVSRIYVDGDLEGTADWSAWASASPYYTSTLGTDALYFGSTGQDLAIRELDGQIDFVRISNEALAPEDFYNPVPEPSTLMLLLVMGGLGMVIRRRG